MSDPAADETTTGGPAAGGGGRVVFYLNPGVTPDLADILRGELPDAWRLLTATGPGEPDAELAAADYLIVATEPVGRDRLGRAGRLRMIQHQGVGYEKIDLAACRGRGVPVGLTPEGTSVGVAEHTLLLILAVYKRLPVAAAGLAAGDWMQWSLRRESFELAGKTVGLVGFGRIGREVARRVAAFDARVIYFDPYAPAPGDGPGDPGEPVGSLEDLLAASDVVSLHVPQTEENRRLMNAAAFARMKPGAALINTARGGLVDEAALLAALESGRLSGAGLDVFEVEPLPAGHPLVGRRDVVLTPHISAGTADAFRAKMRAAVANLVRHHRGEPLRNLAPGSFNPHPSDSPAEPADDPA